MFLLILLVIICYYADMYRDVEKIQKKICEELATGKSLLSICENKEIPSRHVVYGWLESNQDFQDNYRRARSIQADIVFEECMAIADSCGNEDVNKARLMIDTRKWVAGKMKPKKYGDKQQVEHSVKPYEATTDELEMYKQHLIEGESE